MRLERSLPIHDTAISAIYGLPPNAARTAQMQRHYSELKAAWRDRSIRVVESIRSVSPSIVWYDLDSKWDAAKLEQVLRLVQELRPHGENTLLFISALSGVNPRSDWLLANYPNYSWRPQGATLESELSHEVDSVARTSGLRGMLEAFSVFKEERAKGIRYGLLSRIRLQKIALGSR